MVRVTEETIVTIEVDYKTAAKLKNLICKPKWDVEYWAEEIWDGLDNLGISEEVFNEA